MHTATQSKDNSEEVKRSTRTVFSWTHSACARGIDLFQLREAQRTGHSLRGNPATADCRAADVALVNQVDQIVLPGCFGAEVPCGGC